MTRATRRGRARLCMAALALSMPALSAHAAVADIESLSVDSVAISLDFSGLLDAYDVSGSGTVAPPAVITMGAYQDPIWTYTVSGYAAKVYSVGVPGNEPSGKVDLDGGAGALFDLNLSSLRGWIDLGGGTSADFALWPVTTDPTTSSYTPGSGAFSLVWNESTTVEITTLLGTTSATADLAVSLGGTLTPVPAPAAVWLFGAGLAGLASIVRRRPQPIT